MNIFHLDDNPEQAAKYLCNKHIVKMILETAQILSTVVRLYNLEDKSSIELYKKTHANHPCVKWAFKSKSHFEWLCKHGLAMCDEYQIRYNKIHKSKAIINEVATKIQSEIPFISNNWENPPLCMPEKYYNSNYIEAYREYYRKEKKNFAKWPEDKRPDWI